MARKRSQSRGSVARVLRACSSNANGRQNHLPRVLNACDVIGC